MTLGGIPGKKIDSGQRRVIERMRESGLNQSAAGKATGLSKRTIAKYWHTDAKGDDDEPRGKVRE